MPATLLKKTLATVFSCEFRKIFEDTVVYRTPLEAASDSPELLALDIIITICLDQILIK